MQIFEITTDGCGHMSLVVEGEVIHTVTHDVITDENGRKAIAELVEVFTVRWL